jgi:hypothetical protein
MLKLAAAFALLLSGASAIPAPDNGNANLLKRATTFWYANMDHTGQYRGYAPDLDPDFSYPVFQAVNPGDGASIQTAINSGDGTNPTRHGEWLASQPRVSARGKVVGQGNNNFSRSCIFLLERTQSAKLSI